MVKPQYINQRIYMVKSMGFSAMQPVGQHTLLDMVFLKRLHKQSYSLELRC